MASFSGNDPLAAHGELLRELAHVAEPNAQRRPAELQALFAVDASAREMRRLLTAQYIEHAPRSGKIEQQLWQALFDLTHAFEQAYAACEHHLLQHGQDAKWQALLPELVARQIMQYAFDAKIRMFRYEQWIPARWLELHQRYALAAARNCARERLVLAGEAVPVTIELKYIATLLLHVCNAGNVDRAQLDWLSGELDQWCTTLRLAVASPGASAFYVDLAQRHGLRRRGADPLEGQVLFLDTEPLHALLQHYIMAVEAKVRSQPLSAKTPRRVERVTLLTKLAAQIDPEFRPVTRRGERTAAVGKVDTIVGLANISGYLRDEERPTAPDAERTITDSATFSSTLDLAVFGRLRNDADQRKELARRRLASFAPPGGPWELRDVSATGVRLIAPMHAAGTLTLGMLVALRGHTEVVWKLGVVRRMRRMTAERAEVGLQLIADSVTGVDLRGQRGEAHAEGEYSVDGETTSRNDRAFRALFLALHQRKGSVIQSLILPAAEYHAGRRFRLQTEAASYPVRFGRRIEEQADWIWTAIEPFPIADTRAGVAPAG
jgi:hypothetical protein